MIDGLLALGALAAGGLIVYGLIPKPSNAIIEADMVPFDMHGKNVRSRLTEHQWKRVRDLHSQLAGHRCEVCKQSGKQQGFRHATECHEIWVHEGRVQRLAGLIALCPLCHKVKHLGFSESRGFGDRARQHMQHVNGWSEREVQAHFNHKRAQVKSLKGKFNLDLTFLNHRRYGFLGMTFTDDELRNCRSDVYE